MVAAEGGAAGGTGDRAERRGEARDATGASQRRPQAGDRRHHRQEARCAGRQTSHGESWLRRRTAVFGLSSSTIFPRVLSVPDREVTNSPREKCRGAWRTGPGHAAKRERAGLKTRSSAGFRPRLLSSPNRLPRRGDRGSRKACSPSAQRAGPRIEAGWPGNGIVTTGARRLPAMRKTCRVLSI
jgi:hypothetical protein